MSDNVTYCNFNYYFSIPQVLAMCSGAETKGGKEVLLSTTDKFVYCHITQVEFYLRRKGKNQLYLPFKIASELNISEEQVEESMEKFKYVGLVHRYKTHLAPDWREAVALNVIMLPEFAGKLFKIEGDTKIYIEHKQ